MSSVQVITATAKNWIAALNRLTPATSGKKPLPILSMALVSPSAGTLRAVGREVDAESDIEALGSGEPFLVSYAWLKDAITSTAGRNRNAPVTLTAEGNRINLEALGYNLSVETVPVADFPKKSEVRMPASHIALDASELREALGRALIVASKDETLPVLASVRFTSAPEGMRLCATDRYRAVSDLVVGPGHGSESFTVPAAPLRHMVKQFKTGSVYVDYIEDGPVTFLTDDATYTVTPLDGSYPDLTKLFAVTAETVMDVDRVQLLDAAKVADRMSERFTPAFLNISARGVQIGFNDGLFGPDSAPLAAGTLTGAPVEIALNTRLFFEAVNSFKGETVRIHGGVPIKQFTFIDGGADHTDNTIYRHMVMPVRMPR